MAVQAHVESTHILEMNTDPNRRDHPARRYELTECHMLLELHIGEWSFLHDVACSPSVHGHLDRYPFLVNFDVVLHFLNPTFSRRSTPLPILLHACILSRVLDDVLALLTLVSPPGCTTSVVGRHIRTPLPELPCVIVRGMYVASPTRACNPLQGYNMLTGSHTETSSCSDAPLKPMDNRSPPFMSEKRDVRKNNTRTRAGTCDERSHLALC